MYDSRIIPHEHIGDKAIRLDNNEDQDGITYTESELTSLRTSDNEITINPIVFELEAEAIDADNNGIFVDIKKSGTSEHIQIG
jgi:hypothetical protein